jgi:glycerol-3-phosphate dehydrogenase
MLTRQERLASIRQNPEVSVLIIGGGINGIGLYRELALQKVDVLLVEKADFFNGASAASSHMIHGGLRYLENSEFRLVRESLNERNRLLKNAPHVVSPLPTTIPIFSWLDGFFNAALKFLRLSDRSSNRGAVLIKVGLAMYDFITRNQRSMPNHSFASKAGSLALRPALNPDIVCTATYYDAQISFPERLGIELIQDAEAANPACKALNYVRVQDVNLESVKLVDALTDEVIEVRPKVVVNATGAWIDFTNKALHQKTQFIGGTKGSHIMLDNPALLEATQGSMMYFENADGRICIFFPYFDKVMAGSTDIFEDNPDSAVCEPHEVDYIIESIRQVFPAIEVSRDDVVYQFCGVRPLPTSDVSTTGQISRDHSTRELNPGEFVPFPIYSMIGGKWTTFRGFAEQTGDIVLDAISVQRIVPSHDIAIGGGKDYPQTAVEKSIWIARLADKTKLSEERARQLFERYGTRATEIAAYITQGEDMPLKHCPEYSCREILYILEHEYVVSLSDLVLRRTLLAILGKLSGELVEELTDIMAGQQEWSPEAYNQQIEQLLTTLREKHGVHLRVPQKTSF